MGSQSFWLVLLLFLPVIASAQAAGDSRPTPNLDSNIERPLRYRPDGGDFVIVDGEESFNRSLYGRNTAFRVDGGDKPEFVLYLPGRGGNLRLGLRAGTSARWLNDAQRVVTRYRPGELIYEIRDPLLGAGGVLTLEVLATYETDGLLLRYAFSGAARGVEMIAAFGGINGQRGARDGDIGTERVPIREWFQLQPGFCADNVVALRPGGFEIRSAVARIAGVLPEDGHVAVGDAAEWRDLARLLDSGATQRPVVVARLALTAGTARYLSLQRLPGGTAGATELDTYRAVRAGEPQSAAPVSFAPLFESRELPAVFERTQQHFRAIRERVVATTPDPFVDAAVGALEIAADAVWDEPLGDVMHGAIAWRTRLLGWRGPYAMDDLGWHDRARRHFSYWATRQDLEPIPAVIPPAEEATNLARNPAALHSNGDLSNSHYDMNLVYIDALFRHLLWTGDVEFARQVWPVIERHLAWERRLFRREFGADKLPLYEAYAAIWASDDLEYGGGGVTHATAYNWWHNVMAARIAKLTGHDDAPYTREAKLIARAMDEYLWLPEQGMFAEYRDFLGLQRAHPAAALWTFYHAMDAPGLVDPMRATLMSRWVKQNLPSLPVRGPGVEGQQHVLATSNWMPYSWSINNVVMGENMHAALGFWLAGDPTEAFSVFRGALLASMYMGISPGNVGTMNYLDVYRRESQRDFADGAGTFSRALVEGLFGMRPDALLGEMVFEPGWPGEWAHASLRTPSAEIRFRREARIDRYELGVNLPAMQRVKLRLRMRSAGAKVSVAGMVVAPSITPDASGTRFLEVSFADRHPGEIQVEWVGAEIDVQTPAPVVSSPKAELPIAKNAEARANVATYSPIDLRPIFNARVTEIFEPGKYRSPRSPFASLAIPAQGIGGWAGHVSSSADIDDSGLRRIAGEHGGRFTLPDGVPFAISPGQAANNIVFTSQWDNYPRSVTVSLRGRAKRLVLLMAGSTNYMQSRFDNGEILVEYRDGSRTRLALHNPTNWWPIEQDYFIDDFQFRRPEPIPRRVDLKTGRVREEQVEAFKGRGGAVPGGAATVLEIPLEPGKELRNFSVGALANEVVIGLMAATLVR